MTRAALVLLATIAACRQGEPPAATQASAATPPAATSTSTWRELSPGLSYRVFAHDGAKVHAFRGELASPALRAVAVDARTDSRGAATVADLARESGALLLVNGTFFDPAGRPLGLVVTDGTIRNPLRKADWGVLEVAGNTVRLVHTREYTPSPEVTAAIQCGPRVVIAGAVPKLKPERPHRRTAVCVPDPGTLLILATVDPLTTDAMGRLLATPTTAGGPGCRDAMLLDGGPSTQLAVRTPGMTLDLTGGWPVPNGFGFAAR